MTSEFLPTAVLPQIAAEFDIPASQVGFLVTLFALTVVVASAPLTIVTRRFSRKWLLVAMLGLYVASTLMAAIAPVYEVLAVARVIAGLTHALFWAVAMPYVALLVPASSLTRAVSVVTAGITLAFILGVPGAAAIGIAVGWRMSFAILTAAFLVLLVLAVWLLPNAEYRVVAEPGAVIPPLRRDRTVGALAIVSVSAVLLAGGHSILFTYIAPWAIQVGGVGEEALSAVLLAYGLAGVIGLVIAGRFGDRRPRFVFNLMLAGMLVALVGLALLGHSLALVLAGVILWNATFGGLLPMFNTRMIQSASARLRNLTGALTGTAFNAAIGLGALVGGLLLDGLGVGAVAWFAAGTVALALIWTLATDRVRLDLARET